MESFKQVRWSIRRKLLWKKTRYFKTPVKACVVTDPPVVWVQNTCLIVRGGWQKHHIRAKEWEGIWTDTSRTAAYHETDGHEAIVHTHTRQHKHMENKISSQTALESLREAEIAFWAEGAGIWKHRTILETLGFFPDNIPGKGKRTLEVSQESVSLLHAFCSSLHLFRSFNQAGLWDGCWWHTQTYECKRWKSVWESWA